MSKPSRRTRRVDDATMATALAYAELHDDKAASKKFGIAIRTLQRRRADVKAGKADGLAELVADQKQVAVERCADLLTETFELGLRKLSALLTEPDDDEEDDGAPGSPVAARKSKKRRITPREVIGAVKILGELRMTRNMLNEGDDDDDGEQPGTDRKGARTSAPPGAGSQGTSRATGTETGEGAPGGRGTAAHH
jgi:hypothetical protein